MFDVHGNDGGDETQQSYIKNTSSDYKLKAVSILGERNSGTNWIYEYVIYNISFLVTFLIFNMLMLIFSIVMFSKSLERMFQPYHSY